MLGGPPEERKRTTVMGVTSAVAWPILSRSARWVAASASVTVDLMSPRYATAPEAKRMRVDRQGRAAVDGAEIAWWVAGEGPPALLIQGVGATGRAWQPQIEALADRYTLAWFDNRGIGESSGDPKSIEQMADDAAAVLDAVGWDTAHVAGHSMGGVIAHTLALRHTERVTSLSLLCTLSRGSRVIQWSARAMWMQIRCSLGTREMRRRAFFELVSPRALWSAPEPHIEALEAAFGRRLDELPPVSRKQVMAMRRQDLYAELARLRELPILVVSGDEDAVCPPSEGRELAEALDTPLVEVAGGHAVPVQDAERINELLDARWRSAG